jgi:flagellar motility protein MotE (MotC chaperone)
MDVMEDDSKREQFLARNREAASKCRMKKKEWTHGLEERARELSSQKQMLTTYLAVLKNELLMLKCKCLEHSDCDCDAIREYLKTTVNTMPPANAALYMKLEDKDANEISSEIARKQSAYSMSQFSPEDIVSSPESVNGSGENDFFHLEADLRATAED